MAGVVTTDLRSALVPYDHRTGAAPRALVHALEVASRQLVILNWHGQPADRRVHRRTLRDRPRPKRAADKDPQVVVQPGSVVQLHHETGRGHDATLPRAPARRGRG